ncbi:MAG TPA: hypothetical protein VGE93_14880 [Bryobacteraceae bacterium]
MNKHGRAMTCIDEASLLSYFPTNACSHDIDFACIVIELARP